MPVGWADDELTKQLVDSKQIFDVGCDSRFPDQPPDSPANHTLDGFNQWPDSRALPGFRSTVSSYFDACTGLSRTLLAAMAESLGPGAEPAVMACFKGHSSFLRLNYYPVIEQQAGGEERLGISRHTDSGRLLHTGPWL